jgi:hypothetical protein
VLRLEFTWTDFAREEGDRLVVDDAFRTGSGTWLPQLEAGQDLYTEPGRLVDLLDRSTANRRETSNSEPVKS